MSTYNNDKTKYFEQSETVPGVALHQGKGHTTQDRDTGRGYQNPRRPFHYGLVLRKRRTEGIGSRGQTGVVGLGLFKTRKRQRSHCRQKVSHGGTVV